MVKQAIWIWLAVVLAPLLSGCGYNKIQQMEEQVNRAWGDVESNLQRRADLVPNLVETVRGYAAHEKETLQAVIDARAQATRVQLSPQQLEDPQAMQQFLQAQGNLSSALSRLMVVVERYPDLKANQSFLDLQNQLEGTENRINVARQRYNEAAERFNGTIRSFPYNLTNNFILRLDRKTYFQAEGSAREAPRVDFGTTPQ